MITTCCTWIGSSIWRTKFTRPTEKSKALSLKLAGTYLTKIMSFDSRSLSALNSLSSLIRVDNPGRMSSRKISTEIGLRYENADNVVHVVEEINHMLRQHLNLEHAQPPWPT